MGEQNIGSLMHERLKAATAAELARLRLHLCLEEDADVDKIEKAYLDATDNTIFSVIRPLVHSDAPTYSKALRLIFKEMRTYSAALDESWKRVKSLKFWDYRSPINEMSDSELEEQILSMYAAEYADAKKKLVADPGLWKIFAKWVPGFGTAAASTAASVSAHIAGRVPFTAMTPVAVAAPIGLGLAVVLVSTQLAGPAYRKIIPATVEIMLIGRRIACMPEE